MSVCRRCPHGLVALAPKDGLADPSNYIPVRCKSWRCPDCKLWLRGRVVAAVGEAVAHNPGLYRFVTLTLDGPMHGGRSTLEEQVAVLGRAWRRLRARLDRRYGGGALRYLWVREPHADGTLHLHVLVDRYIPQAWLSSAWESVGGGPRVWVEAVDVQRVDAYLAKYLAKDPAQLCKGAHRFGKDRRGTTMPVYPVATGTHVILGRVSDSGRRETRWAPLGYDTGPYLAWVFRVADAALRAQHSSVTVM